MAALAPERLTAPQSGPWHRLRGVLAAVACGVCGYAFGAALSRAKTSDAFMVAPNSGEVAGYAAMLAILAGLALTFEFAAPPVLARGGRAARDLRALIRRRFRQRRSRAEIANVEVGLTMSFCLVLLAVGLVLLTHKVIAAIAMVAAILITLKACRDTCRLVRFEPTWSGLIGALYGLVVGYALG